MTAPRKTTARKQTPPKPTSAAAWKAAAVLPPIELPSGNYMRIKKVGLQTLMQVGIMPNSLMSIATKAVDKGTGKQVEEPSNEDLAVLAADPKKVAELSAFIDKMVVFVAQEPKVSATPDEGVERDPEALYTDEIDDEDKMFILQVVTGGTTNLETFRTQHDANVAAVRGVENVELPSE